MNPGLLKWCLHFLEPECGQDCHGQPKKGWKVSCRARAAILKPTASERRSREEEQADRRQTVTRIRIKIRKKGLPCCPDERMRFEICDQQFRIIGVDPWTCDGYLIIEGETMGVR